MRKFPIYLIVLFLTIIALSFNVTKEVLKSFPILLFLLGPFACIVLHFYYCKKISLKIKRDFPDIFEVGKVNDKFLNQLFIIQEAELFENTNDVEIIQNRLHAKKYLEYCLYAFLGMIVYTVAMILSL